MRVLKRLYPFDITNPDKVFVKLLFSGRRKFNIGSGQLKYQDGWLYSDKKSLDITEEREWRKYLRFLKLDNIVAEHVWEHLSAEETRKANDCCFQFLKRGACLRLAVPDGLHPDKEYIDWVKVGGVGPGADDHKVLYTYQTMTENLKMAGFKVILLEYWDENGDFHFVDWSDEGGKIVRSRRYDPRNSDGQLKYTSLIVDAVKP